MLTYEEIKKRYDKIEYKANDGKWYKLKDYFPLILKHQNPNKVVLDNGKQGSDAFFITATIYENKMESDIFGDTALRYKTI